MRIRWSSLLILALLIVAAAYSRSIGDALRQIPVGEMWQSFTDEFRAMPRLGRFTAVTLVLALLYISAYMLVLAVIRTRNGPPRDGRGPSPRI